ncbi:MAG TPA: hypothetical protein VHD36_05430 [Pirellulales bacterium]|nr:hypothetical protein [Pirellulales bacterium]
MILGSRLRLGLFLGLLSIASEPAQSHAGNVTWKGTTGTWTDAGNWDNGVPMAADSALINNGGTAQISTGTITAQSLSLGVTKTGFVQQTGGTFTVDTLSMAGGAGTTAGYSLTDGTLNATTSIFIGGNPTTPGGIGTFTAVGGSVNTGFLSVFGNAVWTQFRLATLTTAQVLLQAGGSFLGAGTIGAPDGKSLVFNNRSGLVSIRNGDLNIGGDYVQGASGTLNIDFQTINDKLVFNALNVTGQASLLGTLKTTGLSASDVKLGSSFELITATGGVGNTQFGTLTLPTLNDGLKWSVNYNAKDVTLSVVPEPSTRTLGTLGLVGLAILSGCKQRMRVAAVRD